MTQTFEMRPRSDIDRAQWERFVEASDETWMWHLPDIIDVFSTHAGLEDISFGVYDGQGALCAVLPLYLASRRRARVITHRYMESIGGPACAAGLPRSQHKRVLTAIREHLMRLLDEHKAERVALNVSACAPYLRRPDAPRVNPLVEAGFANAQTATWVIDLSPSLEAIRARYLDGTRYELRREARDPYTLREAQGGRDLEIYHDLHRQTNARSGRDPIPLDYLKAIFERFIPTGRARVLLFERKGRVVAAQTTAIYKNAAYYWFGPSATDKSGGENRVLCDEQIMHARSLGCVLYETGDATFDGGDAKLQAISNYKRSFGATLVPRYSARLVSPRRQFRLMRAARALLGGDEQ